MTDQELTIERALCLLPDAKRILVMGCSGGGKSTLSMALSRRFDLPYLSMDRDFFWLPGWVKRDKREERALIAKAVAGERWLMDGTGSSSLDLRLPRAEFVIWVRMPRWLCLYGVFRRGLKHRGGTRPEMAPGCPERMPDREFLSYIWHFEERVSPGIVEALQRYAPDCPVLMLKSRGETARLLDLIESPD
ncbi:AAA family ATPase [Xaviernesmea oryzae]|uniref:AAA family ATPase n=1 Tax=Xaviernesmea oryzae TaxID=464029 RepID=A0A1Q9AX81_9HYPH|nr:AAA family ATPase [Xaviernesmea oryzae]OLP60057.1 AAA family ATPase [Xaviernesmea oryzae]SEK38297.1 Adenylate kinase [Xaviernesmea oryzae]